MLRLALQLVPQELVVLNLEQKYLGQSLALVLAVFQPLAYLLPERYFGSVQTTHLVQTMDLIDIARTFLQRANRLRRSPDLIATLSAPLQNPVFSG